MTIHCKNVPIHADSFPTEFWSKLKIKNSRKNKTRKNKKITKTFQLIKDLKND